MDEELLRQLADEVLEHTPAGAISASLVQSLAAPTPALLHETATMLLAGGHLDAAELLFRALLERVKFGPRAAVGLARVAAQRADPQLSVAAWRDCVTRFPRETEPNWYVEIARAERALGRLPDAEATLQQCREQFPQFAPALAELAGVLVSRGRPHEAVGLWRMAIQNLAAQARPSWVTGYAAALSAAGHSDQGDVHLEEIVRRFQDVPAVLAFEARHAAAREDWAVALDLWTRSVEGQPGAAEPGWLNGRAVALLRLWQAEGALNIWQDLIARYPDFLPAWLEMAAALEELGMGDRAEQHWLDLTARFAQNVAPEWLVRRARCLLPRGPSRALDETISDLETRFPELPLGRHIAIALATRLDLNAQALATLVTEAVVRFPDDRQLLAHQVRVLLGCGRFAEAEAVVRRLETAGDDYLALISRWRLMCDGAGSETLRDSVQQVLDGRAFTLWPALAIGDFIAQRCEPWSMALALEMFNNLNSRYPGRVVVASARARMLIALRRDQEALAVIAAIPTVYESQEVLELRAWAQMFKAEVNGAAQTWQRILALNHFRAVRGEPNLELVQRAPAATSPTEVTAFVGVRNELSQLPEFLRHHRDIGVGHFVVIDNCSTDEGPAYLRAQPDVTLYRTADDRQSAGCGMRWINALIERHGAVGWCLFVDADEWLIYPQWERAPLPRLIEYLDFEGAEAVSAFMLDVYPQQWPSADGERVTHAQCRYYDADYAWIGHVRPPYRRPLGGVRARLFRVKEYLQKVPLIKSGCGIYIDNHETTPLRFSSVTAALLHYKMLGVIAQGNGQLTGVREDSARRGLGVMRRYESYASRIATLKGRDLRAPGVSQLLADSLTLADRGLMQAPAPFRDWITRADGRGR
jgi:tetratricopeptide (TPR) repeat protein